MLDHWEALTSIILSCVAIAIAIISSYQTSKQAERQIAGIQLMIETSTKNADMQIEEIKKMTNQMITDTKKHLISMKSMAIALIENYLLHLESSISSSEKERYKIREVLKALEKEINEAGKEAHGEKNYYTHFGVTMESKEELDKRLAYLNDYLRILCNLREKIQEMLKKIEVYRNEEIEEVWERSKKYGDYESSYWYNYPY